MPPTSSNSAAVQQRIFYVRMKSEEIAPYYSNKKPTRGLAVGIPSVRPPTSSGSVSLRAFFKMASERKTASRRLRWR